MRKVLLVGVAAVAISLTLTACGSSSNGSSSSSAAPAIRRAAFVTGQAPGFKFTGTGTVTVTATQRVVVPMTMTGTYDRATKAGRLTGVATAAGRQLHISELFSRFTLYMSAANFPNASQLTGGKPWIKLDISSALPGGGLSSLPTTTNPAQFVGYLRAVSTSITRLGKATIRGVPTTGYHVVVDLDRYPNLVPAAERSGVRRTIKTLEASLGRHTMPLEVWIDSHHLVRRERLAFTQCVSNLKEAIALTLDLYDYGPQPAPHLPPASQVFDATPLAAAALSHAKLGC